MTDCCASIAIAPERPLGGGDVMCATESLDLRAVGGNV